MDILVVLNYPCLKTNKVFFFLSFVLNIKFEEAGLPVRLLVLEDL